MTPEQQKAAMETMQQWRIDATQAPQPGLLATFWDDIKAYQEDRLQDIEPGLRENQAYMAQLAAFAQSLKTHQVKERGVYRQPDASDEKVSIVEDDHPF